MTVHSTNVKHRMRFAPSTMNRKGKETIFENLHFLLISSKRSIIHPYTDLSFTAYESILY